MEGEMKVISNYKPPALWEWMRSRLPRGLEAKAVAAGYGEIYAINVRIPSELSVQRWLGIGGVPIACITSDTIEIFNPSYYSDFEDMARKYESEVGAEVTLKFWQSPKDAAGRNKVKPEKL